MNGQVNISVANIYTDGAYQSEVISQAILGEVLEIQEKDDSFSLVKLPDGYIGWISNYQWVSYQKKTGKTVRLRSHFAWVFTEPDSQSAKIRDLVIGTELPHLNTRDDWYEVALPDGVTGWVEKKGFAPFPEMSRQGVVDLAREFLGYPYHWGGRSAKGFDCSGLSQAVLSLAGIKLPRDSWMQHRDAKPVSDDWAQAQPGDLLFFAEGSKRITHVGIALGEGQIIHSRGYVRLNSLKKGKPGFDENLARTFVDVRTFF